MGIFCTVRAFLRFRGPEALWDTYMKHRGILNLLRIAGRGPRGTHHAKGNSSSRAKPPNPNSASGRFSQVHRLTIGAQRHRFIVLAL